MTKLTSQTLSTLKSRTRLVYAGRDPFEQHGFVNTPIYRGSTVLSPSVEALERHAGRFTYGRRGTPTIEALETAWSEIAGAAGTVLTPSGLSAVTTAILAVVKSGDHLLVADTVYQPTRHFCRTVLARLGVETTFYDPLVAGDIGALIRPNTSAVYLESPGSQSIEIQDVPAISGVARARGAAVILDNTWATPLMFPAHERGADLAVEAATKYVSGHSDLLLGLVSANEAFWPRLHQTFGACGLCAGPEDVFLALRGLRTMELRLREAERQALALAHWLAARPEVARVLHPALPDFPGHALWKRDFLGSSGLFSVILKPFPNTAVTAMLDGLELFGLGYSWGGFESLVVPFDCSTYRTATTWNPGGPALRFSIGLEDVGDLQDDLDRGFARLAAAGSA
jgi:cystathionine beta-lyase